MFDKYGREIDYIRISVTDRCNLRCLILFSFALIFGLERFHEVCAANGVRLFGMREDKGFG